MDEKCIAFYKNIRNSVPHIFTTKSGFEECVMNIYLTATGVRPASIPFDGEDDFERRIVTCRNCLCFQYKLLV